jgi:hypothetical protein
MYIYCIYVGLKAFIELVLSLPVSSRTSVKTMVKSLSSGLSVLTGHTVHTSITQCSLRLLPWSLWTVETNISEVRSR